MPAGAFGVLGRDTESNVREWLVPLTRMPTFDICCHSSLLRSQECS